MAEAYADQAEGLRRLNAAPLPGLCTVLSADSAGDKPALMQRLAASMMKRGRPVILIDATGNDEAMLPSLLDVALGEASLADASFTSDNGLQQMRLGADCDHPALSSLLGRIASARSRVLVDAQLDQHGQLPLSLLADGELVVQLSATPESVRRAYEMLHALKKLCGRGSVSLLVTDADPVRANKARANLFHAASRYLALPVRSIVPREGRHV